MSERGLIFSYEGHEEAWTKANILHRDVSMGNILIDVDSKEAFLNDWDHCEFASELGESASSGQHGRSVGRTGTS